MIDLATLQPGDRVTLHNQRRGAWLPGTVLHTEAWLRDDGSTRREVTVAERLPDGYLCRSTAYTFGTGEEAWLRVNGSSE